MSRHRAMLAVLVCALGLVLVQGAARNAAARTADEEAAADRSALQLRLRPMPAGARRVSVEPVDGGGYCFVVECLDGSVERLAPDAFARRLHTESTGRSWLFRLLNITSTAGFWWVTLGLAGQVLFTGRMVLQWLVSEKHRKSVVPVGFWWMSLAGATMLLVYFTWRRDIVGVLGQSTGWLIYVRNLWLIYRQRLCRVAVS